MFEEFLLDEPGEDWSFRTPELWRIAYEGDRRLLQMAIPPERPVMPGVRRPQEYALYAKYQFRSFSLSCAVRADRDPAVARRDAVVIFGWQDPTHFYYAHLSGATDEWHNALVRVDGDSRTALVPVDRRPAPTLTDLSWHKVDVLRDANDGSIRVYVDAYDETATPVLEVPDRTYEWGFVGLGSFDDHASFTRFRVEGEARPAARPLIEPIESIPRQAEAPTPLEQPRENSPAPEPKRTRADDVKDVIESRVDGDFYGFNGRTIIKLMDGSVWEQMDYYVHPHQASMPSVVVYRSGELWKMQAEGIPRPVRVRRLK